MDGIIDEEEHADSVKSEPRSQESGDATSSSGDSLIANRDEEGMEEENYDFDVDNDLFLSESVQLRYERFLETQNDTTVHPNLEQQ